MSLDWHRETAFRPTTNATRNITYARAKTILLAGRYCDEWLRALATVPQDSGAEDRRSGAFVPDREGPGAHDPAA